MDEARKSLEPLLALQMKEYVPQAYLVSLYHDLGDAASAQACLKGALRRRDAALIFMAVMPSYAPVRSQSRLADLISVIDLAAKDTY